MNIVHTVTHEEKLHGHHFHNLQVDCGVIIEHVEPVKMRNVIGVCGKCAAKDTGTPMKNRTYVKEAEEL